MFLTFIVPMHNVEKYIKHCLSSIRKQTYKDFEVILVDDASTDETVLLCEKYVERDERFWIVRMENNKGVSAARNEGLKRASGEWVWFIDADDWIEPKALEVLSEMTAQAEDMISFDFIKERGENIRECVNQVQKTVIDGYAFRGRLFGAGYNFLFVWSNIYRRKFLIEHELYFDEELALLEDCEFAVRVGAVLDQCYFVREPLYHYVVNMDSASQKWKQGFGMMNLKAAAKIRHCVKKCNEPMMTDAFGHFMQDVIKVVILKDVFHPNHPMTWAKRKEQMRKLLKKELSPMLKRQKYVGNAAQRFLWFCIVHKIYVPLALASWMYYKVNAKTFWRLYAKIYRV